MAQEKVWDREYRRGLFITGGDKPQPDTKDFVKFLKKEKVDLQGSQVLDLGSGTGRNSIYFAELGAHVTGIEISTVALTEAQKRTGETLPVKYVHGSIGEKLPCNDSAFDIAIDVMSSNSLTEQERQMHIAELHRVVKQDGYVYVKALCKDGDKNAQALLKTNPADEKDTYVMPETEIIERVWSREDFKSFYETYFDIVKLEKKTNYWRFKGQPYRRNFWLGYLINRKQRPL